MGTTGNHKKHHSADKTDKSHDGSGGHGIGKMNSHDKSSTSAPHLPEKSKNVSHVPCKFFRQSICQAGDKCPFSHELDSDQQAVCKYFQKGNCKFGSKCALAHITPDGRHVNKRVKDVRKKEKKDDDTHQANTVYAQNHSTTINSAAQPHHPGSSEHSFNHVASGDVVAPATISGFPAASSTSRLPTSGTATDVPVTPRSLKYRKTSSSSSQASDATSVDPSSVEMASQILSKYNGTSPRTANTATYQGMIGSVKRVSPPGILENPGGGLNNMRSLSSSIQRTGSIALDTSITWSGLQAGMIDGSAILDDDEETLLEDANVDEEDGFREQLVPSALEDLLTPLERERRHSRNSQQKSGRVFSSPSSTKAPVFTFRRGSEPMSSSSDHHYHQKPIGTPVGSGINKMNTKGVTSVGSMNSSNMSSSGSTNANTSGGTASNDLWGPRNLGTPFRRGTGFGSPPVSSAVMDSGALFTASISQTPYKFQNVSSQLTSGPSVGTSSTSIPPSQQQDYHYNAQQSPYSQQVSSPSLASYQQSSFDAPSQLPLQSSSAYVRTSSMSNYGGVSVDNHIYRPLQPYTRAVTEKT